MDALLAPDSIAVIGASPDSWYASNLVDHLTTYGYDGELYYVNPGRETVFGEPCYDSISEVPTVVDLAVVSVPREYVLDTVREAGEMGVPAAVIITAGFAEADAEGAELEAELETLIDELDMAVCGPNTIGFANAHADTVVSSVCSRKPDPGSIGLVSQSGALAFATFFDRAKDEDLDFAYIIASGNEAGLSIADYVEYMAADDRVDVICTYIEGIDQPRRFVDVATQAIADGTPVLAVKIGRSEVAKAASLSHTGSIAGSNAAWDAAFARSGIERVPDIPDLLSRGQAHAKLSTAASPNVCVASTSGGLATLLADLATDRGLSLPAIDGETEQALLAMDELLTFGEMHNPADIRGYGAEVLSEIADILLTDDTFDAYVFAVALPAVGDRAETIAAEMQAIQQRADDPVVFLWTGRKTPMDDDEPPLPYEDVRQEGTLYYDPATAMDAVASLVSFGQETPATPRLTDHHTVEGIVPSVPSDAVLTWLEAQSLLSTVDVEPIETYHATDPTAAAADAAGFDGPVVMKVDSRDVPHRTDANAVAVGVAPDDVEATAATLIENARSYAPDANIEGVLLQPQVAAEDMTEVLVGATQDRSFGPVITVAPGGVNVETTGERNTLTFLPPVNKQFVVDRLVDSQLGATLQSTRSGPAADIDALAELIVSVGRLLTAENVPQIEELDLNPVFVGPDGVSIVDILIRTAE